MSDKDPVEEFYLKYYTKTFNSKGIAKWSYELTHKKVESQYDRYSFNLENPRILEVGAGKAEHFSFVKPTFAEYVNLDLYPEPNDYPGKSDARVKWIQGNILNISGLDSFYDRIIVMCVLHHVDNPDLAIKNILSLLAPGGTLSVFLPSDPGFLNRLNRRLFINPRVKKLGFFDYEIVNAREHHNHYWSLNAELKYQTLNYKRKVTYYPFRIPLASLSLFSVWTITKPG